MADCNFTIPFSKKPEKVKELIQQEITDNGGEITFTENNGTFSMDTPIGTIAGDVLINSGSMAVTITEKPGLVPCKVIKAYLEEYL